MKSYSSREILKMLAADGWYEIECVGSHHQFRHPTKPGKVTLKKRCGASKNSQGSSFLEPLALIRRFSS